MSKITVLNGPTPAPSGSYPSGIIMTAPNGSGWLVTIDDGGSIATSGPFIL